MTPKFLPFLVLGSLLGATPVSSWGQDVEGNPSAPKPGEGYLRVTRSSQGTPLSLDTPIVRFVAKDGKELLVDLVGAVHVGDEAYYDALNDEFTAYDAVLYELVATRNAKPDLEKGSDNPISKLQQVIRGVLELTFQLEEVDYSPENFVHADMTPEEFDRSMQDRGETLLSTLMRMMATAPPPSVKGGSQDLSILFAFLASDRALALKRVVANQFEDLETMTAAFEGPEGSTIITERNKVALETLREQIEAGKKRIAIFYGCGHLPDMAERLADEFGLELESRRWLTAWDLQPKGVRRVSPKPEEAAAEQERAAAAE